MANVPQDLKYTKEHEWVRVEGDTVTVGITEFAQRQLGDVVYVDLPKVGARLEAEESFGSIESVKAVSDAFAPVSGSVVEVNASLNDEPEQLNDDPYGEGWIVKIKLSDSKQLSGLMDAAAYEKFTTEAGQ